jgi:hypothetical protein
MEKEKRFGIFMSLTRGNAETYGDRGVTYPSNLELGKNSRVTVATTRNVVKHVDIT